MSTASTPFVPTSDFVPAALDASRWEALQPLYRTLADRELHAAADLEQLILDRSELDAAAREAHANLYIAMTSNTEDQAAKAAYLDFVENVQPELAKAGFELDRKIVGSPQRDDLESDRYEVMLRDLEADVGIYRDENVPLQTRDTTLGQQYSELCGTMSVSFRGEQKTLPQMGKYLEETDRATREEAWRLVSERRMRDHEQISTIFDEMLEVRHTIALNAGFENYRDYMFTQKHRFDYTPAHCEAFHRAVDEVCVPVRTTLDRQRSDALGVDLRPWDLQVDIKGRPPLRPFADADEMVAGISRVFHRLDPALGAMLDTLRDGESLDLESRQGKAPGGYQENRDRIRRPFIFMNATGMHSDLETMIHEAGHAFHAILCRDEPLVHYRHPPLEFCEVASMSMELLTHPYLGEFYDEADAARARRGHLEQLASLLPWIATIDAFQHWLYTNPGHSRNDRTEKWLELDERFGPDVSWEDLEDLRAVRWQRQLHLFEVPFYYIEYGIAQLGALQLWRQSKADEGTAIANYVKALKLGGARPLPELFGAAGLTFDFGPKTMRKLMDAVEKELAALPL